MREGEVAIGGSLVRGLVGRQFPRWAGLSLRRIESGGTDNAIYRLGDRLAVRLPRGEWAAGQAETELRWLPRFAPQLPLEIPAPLAIGAPACGYPWAWGVYRWLGGRDAIGHRPGPRAARDLAEFLTAFQRIDARDGPPGGSPGMGRGVPLAIRDEATRAGLAELTGDIDTAAAIAVWEDALAAAEWDGPPRWIHGDLHPGNLLVRGGRLTAVIDFGALAAGDPACDLMAAWTYLDAGSRKVFRDHLRATDADWSRGRGWALSVAAIALPYYRDSNPILAGIARRTLAEILG
ncbi:MAG: hypothetical protein QOD41_942 [Cryptosporangiaceae bacterium]|nr:hypothetical protein [Cryptosporangiaceae bacterium]